MKHMFIVTLILFVLIHSRREVFAQITSDSYPFIYYYSHSDQAFVSRRASGGELQTLFSFTSDAPTIWGNGWSPTGRWFMWYPANRSTRAYIASMENTTPYEFFNGVRDTPEYSLQIHFAAWHPTRDELLILVDTPSPDNGEAYLLIYNPTQEAFILNVNTVELINGFNIYSISWSPNGDYIFIKGSRYNVVMDTTGAVLVSYLYSEVDSSLSLNNDNRSSILDWHTSGRWFLLWENPVGYESLGIVRLGQIYPPLITEIAACPPVSKSCYGWLPEAVVSFIQ